MKKIATGAETYPITTAKGKYAVTIRRIKNDINGNAKWEANLMYCAASDYWFTQTFRFQGHYRNAHDEAAWLVETIERRMEEQEK